MIRSLRSAILLALVFVFCTSRVPARTLYLAPNGNDSWSGEVPGGSHSKGPLASLNGARDRIRKLRQGSKLSEPIHVVVQAGTYLLREPMQLAPEDSGTTDAPIIYEAAAGAKPVFTGGVRLTGFAERKGMWVADTRASGAGHFEQLFVNGRRAIRARSPNTWYAFSKPATIADAQGLTSNTADLAQRILTLGTTHTRVLRGLSAADLSRAVLVGYHSWETSRHYIEAIGTTGTAIMTGPAAWEFHHWGPRQRYHLENYRAALDSPGEWFLDSAGMLFYIPLPGETIATAEVVAPTAESFIQITGDALHDRPVSHVDFRNLTFSHSAYHLPPQGHSDPQAEVTIPAAVQVDGANNITFANCEFSGLGGSGVWLRWGCHDCAINHCYIHDVGAGAIKIGERVTPPDARKLTGHITVQDTIVRGCGQIYAGGIGVWIGRSSNNAILHNEISDCMYTGVSVGWEWGYNRSDCDHNDIGFNHIHHLGWGVLSDMGGIYTLGVSPGTTLHDNVIHDVESYNQYGSGGWGLYNDEGSSGILSQNNLVYNCTSSCYHQHYGEDNMLQNNIFCFGGMGEIQLSRPEPHLSFSCENNIICSKGEPLLSGRFAGANVHFTQNLFWRYGGDRLTSAGLVFDASRTAFDAKSVIDDPKFVDPATFNFHLQPDSPATLIGFIPFHPEFAGVRGDQAWHALAAQAVQRPAEFPKP